MEELAIKKPIPIKAIRLKERVYVDTLEGRMRGEAGDWLVTGVDGEQYIVKNDIFERSYITREDRPSLWDRLILAVKYTIRGG